MQNIVCILNKKLTNIYFSKLNYLFLFINKCLIWDNMKIKRGLENSKPLKCSEREILTSVGLSGYECNFF